MGESKVCPVHAAEENYYCSISQYWKAAKAVTMDFEVQLNDNDNEA